MSVLHYKKIFLGLVFLIIALSNWNCSVRKKAKQTYKTNSIVTSALSNDSPEVIMLNTDSILSAIRNTSQMKIMSDAGIGGIIEATIFINKEARYINYELISSPHPIATEAIVKIIPYIRFEIHQEATKSDKELYSFLFRYRYTTW